MADSNSYNPIFVAVDTDSREDARRIVAAVTGRVGGVKLGKQFFMAHGPDGVRDVAPAGVPLFLDVKLHDIPNTVAGGIASLTRSVQPDFITIHASGGAAMVAAARAAAESAAAGLADGKRPKLLAVTVLTSLGDEDLAAMGVADGAAAQVLRLGRMAIAAGADGLVCSPQELPVLRAELGPDALLVTPGIRPTGADVGDQKRVMTPAQAMAAGASYLVIGRPIAAAADPAAAAAAVMAEIEAG